MPKEIDNLISKKVKSLLEKDTLSNDDLKFLALYYNFQKKDVIENSIVKIKKIIDFFSNKGDE